MRSCFLSVTESPAFRAGWETYRPAPAAAFLRLRWAFGCAALLTLTCCARADFQPATSEPDPRQLLGHWQQDSFRAEFTLPHASGQRKESGTVKAEGQGLLLEAACWPWPTARGQWTWLPADQPSESMRYCVQADTLVLAGGLFQAPQKLRVLRVTPRHLVLRWQRIIPSTTTRQVVVLYYSRVSQP